MLLVALLIWLTWIGMLLLVEQFVQWQPRKMDGYAAGAPLVALLWSAWMTVKPPFWLTSMHCGVLAPQILFWTMYVPFWMLVEPNVSQITGAACAGLAVATATSAPVATISAARQAARKRLMGVSPLVVHMCAREHVVTPGLRNPRRRWLAMISEDSRPGGKT